MACLQNGTTLLNNNNLSTFKHSILKYDETRSSTSDAVWNSSQINTFFTMNCQIPFRSNYTKDKMRSDCSFKEEVSFPVDHNSLSDKHYSDVASKRPFKEISKNKEMPKQNPAANLLENYEYESANIPEVQIRNQSNKHSVVEPTPQISEGEDSMSLTAWKFNNKRTVFREENNFHPIESSMENQGTLIMGKDVNEPSHHARRPMNAFLIFCKRHRTVVKNKYPHLENRAVTKILGEWWAGLETYEKASYTELAQQYKNAFFSANPNFKWYKLPAPPLRTLNTRPTNIIKLSSPKLYVEPDEKPQQLFTPGKLADETQLGSITSLINSDMQYTNTSSNKIAPKIISNSDISKSIESNLSIPKYEYKSYLLSPPCSTVDKSQPPKPFKKRMLLQHNDNKSIVRSIFCTKQSEKSNKKSDSTFDSSLLEQALENFVENVDNESATNETNSEVSQGSKLYLNDDIPNNPDSNLTQQELINKVVDHMCSSSNETGDNYVEDKGHNCDACMEHQDTNPKEPRKSFRTCKGLRYAKFMAEGKLFVNKRTKKRISNTKLPKSLYITSNASDKVPRNTETIELNDTIKKLAERTIGKNLRTINNHSDDMYESDYADHQISLNSKDEHMKKMFKAADFNLDEKIEALPSLSLEKFQQKKKENKKRKFLRATKIKDVSGQNKALATTSDNEKDNTLTGSRKRKPRKQSITRLDPQFDNKQNPVTSSEDLDLCGLATLAEVAAKKAKIDQK